jgi:hypothetical protein
VFGHSSQVRLILLLQVLLGLRPNSHVGTAVTVTGIVSPSAGQYSVTLDNQTTTFSAKCSFTKPDTLLFYVTGLDGNQTHDIAIRNEEDKELAVQASGFLVTTAQNKNG